MNENKVSTVAIGTNTNTNFLVKNFSKASAAHADKINTLVHLAFAYDGSGKGGVLNTPTDPRYTKPISFATETGISPLITGLDGTSIYTFSSNTEESGLPLFKTLHPIFYKVNPEDTNQARPATVYETFENLLGFTQDLVAQSGTFTIESESCITNCSYTKQYIGSQAFDPTGAIEPGSMIYKIAELACQINQIKEDALGVEYNLQPYPGDCKGSDPCSLSDKVDALLLLFGGEEYVAGRGKDACLIELTPPETSSGGCPPKLKQSFMVHSAERFYKDSNSKIRPLPENQYSELTPETLDSLYVGARIASPFSREAPYVPLWVWDEENLEGNPHTMFNVVTRWTWNIDGAPVRAFTGAAGVRDADPWAVQASRAQITMDTPFNFFITYEYERSGNNSKTSVIFDNDEEVFSFFEIALYGHKNMNGGPSRVVAKFSGSLAELDDNEFAVKTSDSDMLRVVEGTQKVFVCKDITFEDFDWDPEFSPGDFTLDVNTEIGHKLSHAVITLVHKGGSALVEEEETPTYSEFFQSHGQLKLIGCEVEWFDDQCPEDIE